MNENLRGWNSFRKFSQLYMLAFKKISCVESGSLRHKFSVLYLNQNVKKRANLEILFTVLNPKHQNASKLVIIYQETLFKNMICWTVLLDIFYVWLLVCFCLHTWWKSNRPELWLWPFSLWFCQWISFIFPAVENKNQSRNKAGHETGDSE